MKMKAIKWGDIESMHNVLRWLEGAKEALGKVPPTVVYKAKVKLHGTNAGVQVHPDRTIVAQSRTNVLTPKDDNMGFAKWVATDEIQEFFKGFSKMIPQGCVVYGEWCGPGVQKGTAVNQIPEKVFAIFAVRSDDDLKVHPVNIELLVEGFPDRVKVIPWLPFELTIDWNDREQVKRVSDIISNIVYEVEARDPWVADNFGIEGMGEGIVLYPLGMLSRDQVMRYMFKAKGEKHQVVRAKKPAQVDPEVAKSVEEFVELFVTPARLEQGFQEGCGGVVDTRLTGSFIKWISMDVLKESVAELEAAGLEWKQVAKAVNQRAAKWYQEKVKEI